MKRLSAWLFLPLFLVIPVDRASAECLYGLIIDTSGSMRLVVDEALSAARLLIEKAPPGDRFFLIRFSNEVELEVRTTDQKQELLQALDSLVVSGYPSTVLDAVFLSAGELQKSVTPARPGALVLITDGDEQSSHTKRDDVIRRLREHQLPVFAIGFPHIIPKQRGKNAQKDAVKLLEQLAKSSGGEAWFPRSQAEIDLAVDQILKLRSE